MSDPVDLIIPTLRRPHAFSCFDKLHNIPWPYRLHVITGGKTWAQAINIGLAQSDKKNDVILMDDDVFITPDTFLEMQTYMDDADIFGFKLLFPDGDIQHAGGIVRNESIGHIGFQEQDQGQYNEPKYVCHATTSLIYIKRHVLDSIGGMAEDIPGLQMEDVDFNFRALKAGFKIIQLPGAAVHLQSASKRFISGFDEKVGLAYAEIKKRHFADSEFVKKLESYPKPLAKLELA
jgi:GT2 family glycosyltransferase